MKVFRKKRFIVCLVAVVMFAVMAVTGRANALTDEELLIHSLNDVYFYERCGTGGSSSECGITVSGSTIEEKIWGGLTSFMTEEQAAGVMGNMAHEGGFSPARHETTFLNSSPNFAITTNTNDSYGIGLIQWSFGRRIRLLDFIKEKASALLDKYIDGGRKEYGGLGGNDFLSKAGDADTNTLVALELCYLKQELESNDGYGGILKTTTVEEASDYFLENVEKPADIPGQKPIRRADAQKYYDQFHGKTITGGTSDSGGSSDPACNSCAQGSMNINGAGACLAWPLGSSEKDYDKDKGGRATDLLKESIVKLGGSKWRYYLDKPFCSGFTAAVVRWSGYDKRFPFDMPENTTGQANKILENKKESELWDIIDWDGDKSDLQGGDIINCISFDHSWMVIEDENGELYRAEGSRSASTFGHVMKYKNSCGGKGKIIRAKNAKNSNVGVNVKEMGGVKTSSMTGTIANTGKGNRDIGASAIELAWPAGTKKKVYVNEPYDKFKEFYISLPNAVTSGIEAYGKSCDYFTRTVVVYAGLGDENSFPLYLSQMPDYFEKSGDWEEVKMNNPKKVDEYQSGDVIIFYKSAEGAPSHVGIFAEDNNGKHIVQASHADDSSLKGTKDYDPGYYGRVRDTGNITSDRFPYIRVFRNKNNKSGGEKCNICDGEGSEAGQLKAGGFTTVEEAKAFMQSYIDAAMPGGTYWKKTGDIRFGMKNGQIHDAGCPYGVLNNCVAFSQWFINNYTTIGPNWNNTTNGVALVGALQNKGLERGKDPKPYAVFSKSGPSAAGHTGVILGVNTETKKAIVGEASCNEGRSFSAPAVREYSFSEMRSWWYAYTDSVISMGGPLQNV